MQKVRHHTRQIKSKAAKISSEESKLKGCTQKRKAKGMQIKSRSSPAAPSAASIPVSQRTYSYRNL